MEEKFFISRKAAKIAKKEDVQNIGNGKTKNIDLLFLRKRL